jgi:hypothetical protein
MRIRLASDAAVQYVRKVKAKSIKAGRRRGRDVRVNASERDKQMIGLAQRLRQKHPYDRAHSTRWLAGEIVKKLGLNPSTVRSRLAAFRFQ